MPDINWKTKLLVAGTLLGAIVGLVTAVLLARAAEEDGSEFNMTTGDILKVALSVVGTMRGIAALGNGR